MGAAPQLRDHDRDLGVLRPHYLSIFWEPLKQNPWDIVVGIAVVVVLVALNVVGIQEAANLNILLAVIDFATQLLLVVLGFVLIFNAETLRDNIHWGTAPTWASFALAIPVGMIAYTGIETVSNLAEEARDPVRSIPASIRLVAIAVFAIYFTLPAIALSALPVKEIDGELTTLLAVPPEEGASRTTLCSGLVENLGLSGFALDAIKVYVGVLAATILFIAANAGVIGASRITYSMASYRQIPGRVSAAAPAVQDSVALARRVRRDRLDPRHPAGADGLPGHDVLVRRDALVHRRARLDRGAARALPGPELALPRASNVRIARVDGRCSRSSAGSHRPGLARRRHAGAGHALGGSRLARARLRDLHRLPPAGRARADRGDGARADRLRPGARARVPAPARPVLRARPPTTRSTSRPGSRPNEARRSSR